MDGLHLTHRKRQRLYGVLYILPIMLIIVIFDLIPIVMAFLFSFTDYNILQPPTWIGLDNYRRIIGSKNFIAALINTIEYVVITVPVQTILALAIAVFIAEKMKNSKYGSFLKGTIFIPVVISNIAAAAVWRTMFQTKSGIVNEALGLIGIGEQNWLGSKVLALICVCIVAVWKNVGYYMVIYFAGVIGIDRDVQEAAVIDGATDMQRLRYVTVPMLRHITYMVVTVGIINSFQLFDVVYQLTGGGPGNATMTLAYLVYKYAFSNQKMGYASAMAIFLLIFVLIVQALQNLLFKDKE